MVIFHSFLYVYQRVILWNNNNSQRLIKYSRYSPTEASAEWKPPPWLWPSAVQQLQTGDSWKVRNVSSFKKRGLSNCGNGRSTIYKIYMEHPALIDGFPIKISICKRFPARHVWLESIPRPWPTNEKKSQSQCHRLLIVVTMSMDMLLLPLLPVPGMKLVR